MAERGPRDAAPRADEAVRPHQSARAAGQGLRRRAAAPGQHARHAVQHGRLPDQAEARRAGAHLPHDSRAGERRVRAARRPAPQHLPQFAEAARRHAAAEGRCRGCASPARSPAARAMWNAPRSACWPAASPPPSGSASRSRCRRRPPRTARCSATSPAATSRRSTPGPRSFQPMNVNFGLFPPLAQRADARRRRQAAARHGKDRRQEARALRAARWPISTWIGGARHRRRIDQKALAQIRARRAPQHPLPPPLRQLGRRNGR